MKLFLALWLLTFSALRADLPYKPLQFKLSSNKPTYFAGEKIKFTLTIYNRDTKNTWPVLLPDEKPVGRKLVYFRILQERNGKVEVLATEERELHSDAGQCKIKYLKPGEKTSIVLYLNDMDNYYSKGESNHYMSVKLSKGTYSMQVFYNPQGIASDKLYTIAHNTDQEFPPGKLVFPGGGELSSPCGISIVNRPFTGSMLHIYSCGTRCSFCKKIEKKKWRKVAKHIHQNTQRINKEGRFYADTTLQHWMLGHKNVTCISDGPESVLDILPTFYSREAGFRVGTEMRYFSMVFQLGKIYRRRARMQQLLRGIFRSGHLKLFETEDVNYTGLSKFVPLSY